MGLKDYFSNMFHNDEEESELEEEKNYMIQNFY